jgi:hypothetical protein
MRIAQPPDIREKLAASSSDAVGNSSAGYAKKIDAGINMRSDFAKQATRTFE